MSMPMDWMKDNKILTTIIDKFKEWSGIIYMAVSETSKLSKKYTSPSLFGRVL
jgi:hypothetical protein